LILSDVRKEYGFTLPQAGLKSTVLTDDSNCLFAQTGYACACRRIASRRTMSSERSDDAIGFFSQNAEMFHGLYRATPEF
jgi:hypothetical protein